MSINSRSALSDRERFIDFGEEIVVVISNAEFIWSRTMFQLSNL